MININCIYYDRTFCNHTSARGLFFNKECILISSDPRIDKIDACTVKMSYPRPNPPPKVM